MSERLERWGPASVTHHNNPDYKVSVSDMTLHSALQHLRLLTTTRRPFSLYSTMTDSITSIHSGQNADIYDIPMRVLIRPFPPDVNEEKVKSLMVTLSKPETESLVPPVDVLWVEGTEGGNYYYSFGGCHRYTAHQRLGKLTIKAKLIKSTVTDLQTYLGSSTPDLK